MKLLERNIKSEESSDVSGVLFRLIIFAGLLFVISFLLEGCSMDMAVTHSSEITSFLK